jgi:NADH dehydrogenase (ubiquinone) 1 alpha subcomplex subunit 2
MSWKQSLGKIRELRFIMCQMSEHSAGVRNFVEHNYMDAKKANPAFPFIVRECSNAIPTITARYDFGIEKRVFAEDFSEAQVETSVKELVE